MEIKNEEVVGKTIHEVWPNTNPSWINSFGKVAITGAADSIEIHHPSSGKQYHCNIYRPEKSRERFCVIFEESKEPGQVKKARESK
jgi:hypothetical protein